MHTYIVTSAVNVLYYINDIVQYVGESYFCTNDVVITSVITVITSLRSNCLLSVDQQTRAWT